MGMRAHIACVWHALALAPCAAVLAVAVLLVATPAQARPRLFGTVEFQMDLDNVQYFSHKFWLNRLEFSSSRALSKKVKTCIHRSETKLRHLEG